MSNEQTCAQIDAWLALWENDPLNAKNAFTTLYSWLKNEGMLLEFNERPNISYSLRAKHTAQNSRPLFVLVDVVDDDPNERWLSVCFYADMVQDPDEIGDFVPKGLMNEDALCLNLDEDDENMFNYIHERIKEAAKSAENH